MPFPEFIKLTVKKKANFTCCWCEDRSKKVDVHHIIPEAEDGPDTEDNAAPLCGSCHDLYGNNPSLRKEIRARRDHWYEQCAQKSASSTTLLPPYDEVTLNDLQDGKLPVQISEKLARWCVIEQVLPALAQGMENHSLTEAAEMIRRCTLPEQLGSRLRIAREEASRHRDLATIHQIKQVGEIIQLVQQIDKTISPEIAGHLAHEIIEKTRDFLGAKMIAQRDFKRLAFFKPFSEDDILGKLQELVKDYR